MKRSDPAPEGWRVLPVALASVLAAAPASAAGPTGDGERPGSAPASATPAPVEGNRAMPHHAPSPVPGFTRPRPDLLSGGQPGPDDWAALRAAGVTRVVNLRTADEMAGRDAEAEARAAGLDYVSLPVDGAAGVTAAKAQALWQGLESDADGVTLVHCASGNRVGALLALGAAQSGAMAPGDALAFGRAAGLSGLEGRVRGLLGLPAAD